MNPFVLFLLVSVSLVGCDYGDTCSDACWNMARLDCVASTSACEEQCEFDAWDTECVFEADTCAEAARCP